MAPPPKYLISRKLVKRFFERYLPSSADPEEETPKMQELWTAYETYGTESPVCRQYEAIYDQEYSNQASFKKRILSLKLKESVTSKLTAPKFKIQVKGRFPKRIRRPPASIFDGVK